MGAFRPFCSRLKDCFFTLVEEDCAVCDEFFKKDPKNAGKSIISKSGIFIGILNTNNCRRIVLEPKILLKRYNKISRILQEETLYLAKQQ